MFKPTIITMIAVLVFAFAGAVQADVLMETAPVGNVGNVGEPSGYVDGWGPDRVCGAVDYSYRIGKYEVTAGQYTEFLNAVGGVDTYRLYDINLWLHADGCRIERYDGSGTAADPYQHQIADDWANRPVNFVSWGDAVRFANWLHNGQPKGAQILTTTEDGSYFLAGAMGTAELLAVERKGGTATWVIPSEDEWYKAAYHLNDGVTAKYWEYPTCSNAPPSNDLIDPDPGNNATVNDNDWTIGSPYYRTEVGEHENSDSPYGTFDQGGNVWEWNEEIYFGYRRGLRGGSFYAHGDRYMDASYRGTYSDPAGEFFNLGFRVA